MNGKSQTKLFILMSLPAFAVGLTLFADSVNFPADMASGFVDNVTVFDAVLSASRFDDLRQFKLTIKIEATVTNSICLRLGRDGLYGTFDNALALEETFLEIGIERNGEMYLLKNGLKERYAHTLANPGTLKERILTFKVRVDPDNSASVKSVIFEEDETPFSFDGLQTDPCPADLNPALWTDLRLLVRNGGTQSVEVKFMKDGSLIVIR